MSVSNNDLYVVQFEPHADQSRVHHMLLFGCTELYDNENISPGYWFVLLNFKSRPFFHLSS